MLGHSDIETTRIYVMENGREHERLIERLGLLDEDWSVGEKRGCSGMGRGLKKRST